jgi:fatty acid-binding protein DegV
MAQFGIRPVLGVKNGKIRPIGIKRGAKDIVSGLYKEFEQRIFKIKEKKGKIKVAIAHADVLEKAEELKEKIEKLKDVEVVYINLIGNILGGLVGPGAIALAWQYD